MRAAIYDVMRFWMRRRVDGFRVDVIYHLIKDDAYRDNPLNPAFAPASDPAHRLVPEYTTDRPEVQEIVREMRCVLDEFGTPDTSRVLIGEVYLPVQQLMNYYGMDPAGVLRGAQLPFNFHLIGAHWQAAAIDRLVREYEAALPVGAAPNWVLGNHDKPRIASRVGAEGARLAAMLLLTLRGTPTLYYGDELGMTDVPISLDDIQDPFERREPGRGLGRDPQRTPMPWRSDALNAGFSSAKPWLPLGRNTSEAVDRQHGDPHSTLSLYRQLLGLRRRTAALNEGAWTSLGVQGDVLIYARGELPQGIVVMLNFGTRVAEVDLTKLPETSSTMCIWLSTRLDRAAERMTGLSTVLRPEEGLLLGPSNQRGAS